MLVPVTVPTFREFAALLVEENDDIAVEGVLRGDGTSSLGWFSWGGVPDLPVDAGLAAGTRGWRVLRHGRRLRTWNARRVLLQADDEAVWSFEDGEPPTRSTRAALRFGTAGTNLLERPSLTAVTGGRLAQPLGPVEAVRFLDRDAWVVRFAPDLGVSELVADARTGLPLRIAGSDGTAEWTEFVEVDAPSADSFTWTGPTREPRLQLSPELARQEKAATAGAEWFEATIGPLTRTVEAEVELRLSLDWIHTADPETGAFEASLAGGRGHSVSVARRVRDGRPAGSARVDEVHRWNSERFTWALWWSHGDPFGTGVLERVAAALDTAR